LEAIKFDSLQISLVTRNSLKIFMDTRFTPLLESIRKAAVSHGSVEGSQRIRERAKRDERTKKLIRLSRERWSGRRVNGRREREREGEGGERRNDSV